MTRIVVRVGLMAAVVLGSAACSVEPVDEDVSTDEGAVRERDRARARNAALARVELCFERNWAGYPFEVIEDIEGTYRPDGNPLLWTFSEFQNSVHGVLHDAFRIVSYFDEGTASLRSVAERIRRTRDEQDLLQHETTMLAMCVVSQYLTYEEHKNILERATVLARRRGVCQDYAFIGSRLLRAAGLRAWVQGSFRENHMWVEVELAGANAGRYYLEPQANPLTTGFAFIRKP
jgi:hypothetical protein